MLLFLCLAACNNTGSNDTEKVAEQPVQEQPQVKNTFFPVTDFIKGQIAGIKNGGVNPQKITKSGGHTDSVWLKIESLNSEMAEFLTPVIDSTGFAGLFRETSFNDQTINAMTLTYDAVKPLPDSMPLQHWDVYVDPQSYTVKRVYMLKKLPADKILQLTWEANKSCKLVYISKDPSGKDSVEKEITINWDF